jgi:SWIM zinc finger
VSTLPSSPPPVRHGRCRLAIHINDTTYKLRRHKPVVAGGRTWSLTKPDGSLYCVSRYQGLLACSCPDHQHRGARCKHMRALVAAGILSGRTAARPKGGA